MVIPILRIGLLLNDPMTYVHAPALSQYQQAHQTNMYDQVAHHPLYFDTTFLENRLTYLFHSLDKHNWNLQNDHKSPMCLPLVLAQSMFSNDHHAQQTSTMLPLMAPND